MLQGFTFGRAGCSTAAPVQLLLGRLHAPDCSLLLTACVWLQLEGIDAATVQQVGPALRIGRVSGQGRGYFKLQKGIQLQLEGSQEQADHGNIARDLRPDGTALFVLILMPSSAVAFLLLMGARCLHGGKRHIPGSGSHELL